MLSAVSFRIVPSYLSGNISSSFIFLIIPLSAELSTVFSGSTAFFAAAVMNLAGVGIVAVKGAAGAFAFPVGSVTGAQGAGHSAVAVRIFHIFAAFSFSYIFFACTIEGNTAATMPIILSTLALLCSFLLYYSTNSHAYQASLYSRRCFFIDDELIWA